MNKKRYQTPAVVDLQAVTDMPIADGISIIDGSNNEQWSKERQDDLDDENANTGNGYGNLW